MDGWLLFGFMALMGFFVGRAMSRSKKKDNRGRDRDIW